MADRFHCTLVTPEEQLFDEAVSHVSVPAWDGQIGLLARRAPMLVKLGYGPLQLDLADGKSKTYFVGGGFAQMKGDQLVILTDEAMPVEDVDAKEAKAALNEALALRAIGEESAARRDRDLARARGMMAVATGS
ncbi:ATP synthase F1 subunit epsilon [Phycisphaerales bacterium AB-hyl4]|uniref:ATP synthase epsilon chain n=1 Tax=Natronomicrosphaera hydrolytica TaxID=3242702 RepID=A0ABV4U1Z4_9BACT